MTETVTREIPLGPPGVGAVPVLLMSWTASDPLAVVLIVGARPAHPSLLRGRWVVLRDRLREVLEGGQPAPPGAPPPRRDSGTGPVGSVDVAADGGWVLCTLRGGGLPTVVTVPEGPVREFLVATEAVVPIGAEPWRPALDAEILRMLDRS